MEKYSLVAKVVGPMPPYYEVAEAIWGKKPDIDSDGNSDTPESSDWRELTVILRPGYEERLDIDPLEGDGDKLKFRATSPEILERASSFMQSTGAIQIQNP